MMQSARATSQILLAVQNSAKAPSLTKQTTEKCIPFLANKKFSTSGARATNKSKRLNYEGILASTYTPFTADGEKVALDSIPKYSKFLASKGIKGVLVGGTNGEGMIMTTSERTSVTEAWIEAGKKDKLHVQAHVGGTNIKDALYLAKHAENSGVDSILTLPELFHKPPSVPALVQYIRKIADAAPSTPILYYHNPSMSSVNYLDMVQLMTQAGKEIPTFAGIKFTDGDMITGTACANLDPDNLKVFLGANEVMSGAYLLGFTCGTSAPANMFPTLCLELVQAVHDGRLKDAREKQKQLNLGMKVVSQYGNRIACYKAATEIISGAPLGPTRFPIPALDDQAKEKLRNSIKQLAF